VKYLTSSTTTLSVLIAIVLFALATWIEGEPPPALRREPAKTPQMIREVREETGLRDDSTLQSCRDAEASLLATVEAAQSCSVDEDCTILDYGYPIQCLTSIAQSAVSTVRIEYRNYEQACEFRVYYDCPSEPLRRVPVCRNSRCAVELSRNEILEELTREFLSN